MSTFRPVQVCCNLPCPLSHIKNTGFAISSEIDCCSWCTSLNLHLRQRRVTQRVTTVVYLRIPQYNIGGEIVTKSTL
ncbi:hypothetical protein D3C86_1262780 [compost metagenome]